MRVFAADIKKICTSYGFFSCVIFTVVLLFSAQIYVDPMTQNRYSVIRAAFEYTRERMCSIDELCAESVIQNARSGWFTLFAPITAAFCFVPIISAERDEKAVRFQIIRTSKAKYFFSQFFSGIISGGIAVLIGYIIFAAAAAFLFPSAAEIQSAGIEFNFTKAALLMFLFGAFWSIPAMLLASVIRNKYLVLCIPFFLKYALSQTSQMLLQNAVAGDFDEKIYKLANIINPDGILWISDYTRLNVILVFGISAIIFTALFIAISFRRGDCGA